MTDFDTVQRAIAALGDKTPMGDAFEHVVTHFLERDRAVGFSDVWLWEDWPERRKLGLSRDQGIDIVARDAEGRRVAHR